MDKIIIQAARFQARVGVSEEERAVPQEILVDIEAFLDLKNAGRTDDWNATVCYRRMHASAAAAVARKPYALIEAIAESITSEILGAFPVQKTLVRVKKPAALADQNVAYAAVEIIRTKNG